MCIFVSFRLIILFSVCTVMEEGGIGRETGLEASVGR